MMSRHFKHARALVIAPLITVVIVALSRLETIGVINMLTTSHIIFASLHSHYTVMKHEGKPSN